jgi:hypothetical protein
MSPQRPQAQPSRRQVLAGLGLTAAGVLASQAFPAPAQAATRYLHDDTALRGQGKLYSGSANRAGCDTAASSDCPGPGRLSAYWGGLYVHSTTANRLRTGPFSGCGASFPGNGNTERMRWASTVGWAPEYRFTGRIFVYDISARPDPWTGLVFHPVHINNCNNYFIRIWERDNPRLTFARETNDAETAITRVPFPTPALNRWHDYRIDVLPGSRVRFYWNGALVLDATDPARAFTGGPVGMRLDYFDTVLQDTRVYVP